MICGMLYIVRAMRGGHIEGVCDNEAGRGYWIRGQF